MTTQPATEALRILVVDDNAAIHDDFRKILECDEPQTSELENTKALLFGTGPAGPAPHNFKIDSAFQGEEGLRKVETAAADGRPYALAFIDIRMPPGWDGVETIIRIRKVRPDLQIVICTAYSDHSWSEILRQIGPCSGLLVLKKPFDNIEVLQMAHTLTEKWRLSRQVGQDLRELDQKVARRTAELKESEERFRSLFENATVGLYRTSAGGEILMANPTLIRTLGYASFEDIVRVNLAQADVFASNPRRTFLEQVERDGTINSLEGSWRRKDGSLVHVRESARVVRDAGGRVLYYEGTVEDITERKQVEETLRMAQFSVDHVSDAVYWIAPDSRITYVNNAACGQLGYPREELLGMKVPDFDPNVDPAGWLDIWARQKQQGSQLFEGVHRTKEGRCFPVEVNANHVNVDGREFSFAFVRDITERKRAEEELRRERALFANVIGTIPDLIWLKDTSGVFLACNPGFERLLGVTAADIVGKTDHDFFSKDLADAYQAHDREVMATNRPNVSIAWLTFLSDGRSRQFETIKAPMVDKEGKPIGVVGIARDISSRNNSNTGKVQAPNGCSQPSARPDAT